MGDVISHLTTKGLIDPGYLSFLHEDSLDSTPVSYQEVENSVISDLKSFYESKLAATEEDSKAVIAEYQQTVEKLQTNIESLEKSNRELEKYSFVGFKQTESTKLKSKEVPTKSNVRPFLKKGSRNPRILPSNSKQSRLDSSRKSENSRLGKSTLNASVDQSELKELEEEKAKLKQQLEDQMKKFQRSQKYWEKNIKVGSCCVELENSFVHS